MKKLLLILLTVFGFSLALFAQNQVTVDVVVTDPLGNPMPGVTVDLIYSDCNELDTLFANTDSLGIAYFGFDVLCTQGTFFGHVYCPNIFPGNAFSGTWDSLNMSQTFTSICGNTGPPCSLTISSSDSSGYTYFYSGVAGGTAPFTYSWDFGDGNFSAEVFPVHVYSDPGTYAACLTVIDSNGLQCSECISLLITGGQGCGNPGFLYDIDDSGTGLTVEFLAENATNPNFELFWDFGDSTGFSFNGYVEYTFAEAGTYLVCLDNINLTTGENCIVCDSITVENLNPCLGEIEVNQNPDGSTTLEVDLQGELGTAVWDMGDGTILTGLVVDHTYAIGSTYTACANVVTSNGEICQYCETITTSVPTPCYVNFITIDSADWTGFCPYGITGPGPHTFSWDFGNGDSSNLYYPSVLYDSVGPYQVCLEVTDANGNVCTHCESAYPPSISCNVNISVVGDSIFSANIFGLSGQLSYDWDFGDNTFSSEENPIHQYTNSGIYPVSLIVTDSLGNECTGATLVWIIQPTPCDSVAPFNYGVNTAGTGLTLDFFVGNIGIPGYEYSWDFGDNNGTSTDAIANYTYSTPGTYNVCLESTNISTGEVCYECNYLFVDLFNSTPCNVNFITIDSADWTGFCPYGITGPGPHTFSWDFGNGDSSNLYYPSVLYDSAGPYQVCLEVTDANGNVCTHCESAYPPTINCNVYISVINDSIFSASVFGLPGFLNYFWDFGDGNSSTEDNPIHQYVNSGTYPVSLVVTDSLGNECTGATLVWITQANNCNNIPPFNYGANTAGTGLTLDFFAGNIGTPGFDYAWDYGDNNGTGTGALSLYTYAEPGTYYVCLESTNLSTGEVCVECQFIVVDLFNSTPCFVNFITVDSAGWTGFCPYGITGPAPHTYSWDFGNGDSANVYYPWTLLNPPGPYTVCLTVTDANGVECTHCETVYPPSLSCDVDITYVGDSLFSASVTGLVGQLTYDWNFGDNTFSSDSNPLHIYANPGTYPVFVIVSDSLGNQCTGAMLVTIPVVVPCNIPYFTYSPSTLGNGLSIDFMVGTFGSSNYDYFWDFGDGSGNSTNEYTNYTYSTPGTYFVCLVSTDLSTGEVCDQCFDVTVDFFNTNACNGFAEAVQNPDGTMTLWVDLQGAGGSAIWDLGDGTVMNGLQVSHTYLPNFSYTACATVVMANSSDTCFYCTTFIVTEPCWGGFAYVQDSSNLNEMHFYSDVTGIGPFSYDWDFGDGTTSNLADPSHIYPAPGDYFVCFTSTDALGSSCTYCQIVTVSGIPPNAIYGSITANNITVSNGMVYLIQHDSTAGTLTLVDSTDIPQGFYNFYDIPDGDYLVKAALTSSAPNYNNFVPTYYVNSLIWSSGVSISVEGGDIYNAPINLIAGTNTGGPGFVGGLVTEGANFNGPGDAIAGVEVVLLDLDGNVIAYTYSEADGSFGIDNIPYGSYKVHAEVLGKPSTSGTVIINQTKPSEHNVIIEVNSDYVVAYVSLTDTENPDLINAIKVMGNPIQDELILSLAIVVEGQVSIRVLDLLGRTAGYEEINSGQSRVTIPMQDAASGMYIVELLIDGKREGALKIMK